MTDNPYRNQDPWGGPPAADPWGAQQGGQPSAADPWSGPQAGLPNQQPQQRRQGPPPPDIDDLTAGAGRFAFGQDTPVGTVVGGDVLEIVTELDRFQPYWDDGNPNWRIRVVVQTQLRDNPGDDGKRNISVKTFGDNFRAFQDAVKEAGGAGAKTSDVLKVGGQLWVKLTSHRRSSKGGNPELMFAYKIIPPGGAATPQSAPAAQPNVPPQQPPAAPPPPQAAPPAQPPAAPPQQPQAGGQPQQAPGAPAAPWPQPGSVPEEPPF